MSLEAFIEKKKKSGLNQPTQKWITIPCKALSESLTHTCTIGITGGV